jgi:hypothetical protein
MTSYRRLPGGCSGGLWPAVLALLFATVSLFAAPSARVRSSQEAIARELLANFTVGHFAEASRDFNQDMRGVATPKLLADTKQELDTKYGAFRGITEARLSSEHGMKIVDLITKYDRGSVDVHVIFDAFNQVGMVEFRPIIDVDPDLDRAARELFANFNAGRYEAVVANFDGNMRAQLPPQRLPMLAKQLADAFGAFRAVTGIRQDRGKDFFTIDLTADYERGPVLVRIVFAMNHRVTGLTIGPLTGSSR